MTIASALVALIVMPFDALISRSQLIDNLPGDVQRIVRLSEIFGHGLGMFLAVTCLWLVAPQLRRRVPRLIAYLVAVGLAVNLIKLFVFRLRPSGLLDVATPMIQTWKGVAPYAEVGASTWNWDYIHQSFPSGHSAMAVALAIGLSQLVPRGRWLFRSTALLACFHRILSDSHWPSDVMLGVAVAGLVGAFFWNREASQDGIASNLGSDRAATATVQPREGYRAGRAA